MTIYLMRHGQTLFNQLKRVQGWCDSPLTEDGIKQAEAARDYFKRENIHFDYAYSSTQERAEDTLRIVYGDGSYDRKKDLKEWHFGKFEGAPEYLNPKHPGQPTYGDFFVQYDGEANTEVVERMNRALNEIAESHQGEDVLVVSHGGAMWNFFLAWRKETDEHPKFSNCCILKYEYDGERFDFIESVDPVALED